MSLWSHPTSDGALERLASPEHIQGEFEEQTFQEKPSQGRKLRPLICLCQVAALLALGAVVAVLMLHPKLDELLSLVGAVGHPSSGERLEDSTLQAPLVGVNGPTRCQDWDVRLLATPELPSGTPEVFVEGRFRPICGISFWDDGHDGNSSVGATIFCRQLGFQSGKMTPTAHSKEEEPGRDSYKSDAVFVHSCESTSFGNLSTCGGEKMQPPASGSLHFPPCRAKQKIAVIIACVGDSERLESNPSCTTADATNVTTSHEAEGIRGMTATTTKASPKAFPSPGHTQTTSVAAKTSLKKATTATTTTTTKVTTNTEAANKPILRDVFGYSEGHNLTQLQGAMYKRCALVGASSVLTGKGHGADIDAHDVVIRVNRLPNPEYWHDFGQSCHVLFLNDNIMHSGKVTLMRDGAEVLCKYLPNCKDAALIFRDDWGPCELERLQTEWGTSHPFVGCPHMNFTNMARRFSIMYDQPSTGFLAFLTFAPLCQELNVYGFAGRATADHHVEWKGHPLEIEHRLEHQIADGEWSLIQYKKNEDMDKWFAKHATNVNMIQG